MSELEKPKTKKCTGCGECCLSEKCGAAVIAFGDKDDICPALRLISPGFYRCGIVLAEQEAVRILEYPGIEPLISDALGIGTACTNDFKKGVVNA